MNKYNKVMENIVVSKDMRDRVLSNIEKELENPGSISEERKKAQENEKKAAIRKFTVYAKMAAAFTILVVGAYAVSRAVPFGEKSASTSYDAMTTTGTATESAQMIEAATEEAATTEAATEEAAFDEAATENAAVTEAAMEMEKPSVYSFKSENAESSLQKAYPTLSMLSRAAGVKFKAIQYLDSFASSKDYYLYDKKIAMIFYDMSGNEVVIKEMLSGQDPELFDSVSGASEDMISETYMAGDIEVTILGKDDTYTIAKWSEGNLVFELESTEGLTLQDMSELMDEIVK